jgi:hypothetical protein
MIVQWAGHVAQMGQERNCTRFRWESPEDRDHSEDRGVDGIRMDLTEIGWGRIEWIQLAQGRGQWQVDVNMVMNLHVLAPQS